MRSTSQCTKIFLCLKDVLKLKASKTTSLKTPIEIQSDECVDPVPNFYGENRMQYTNLLHIDFRHTRNILYCLHFAGITHAVSSAGCADAYHSGRF
jgi:hypothetical protein